MTRDDVIRSTAGHIQRVGELVTDCTHKLNLRAVWHDASKWSPEEWSAFEEATPKLADLVYGSDEYKASLASIRPAIDHHQKTNSHHPEFYPKGIEGMSLLDLLEMLCDWKAAGERHNTGNIMSSLAHNRERFGISDQLLAILINTAKELKWTELGRLPLIPIAPCTKCKRRDAVIDYNGHGCLVCEFCYDSLNDAFDEDYA